MAWLLFALCRHCGAARLSSRFNGVIFEQCWYCCAIHNKCFHSSSFWNTLDNYWWFAHERKTYWSTGWGLSLRCDFQTLRMKRFFYHMTLSPIFFYLYFYKALRAHGCEIDYLGSSGCLPVHYFFAWSWFLAVIEWMTTYILLLASYFFHPQLAVRGTGLCSGLMRLEAKLSSQYVSSVLISAPYAIPTLTDAESFLDLVLNEENPTSLPYIRMTLSLMRQFGMPALELASNHFRIPTVCRVMLRFVWSCIGVSTVLNVLTRGDFLTKNQGRGGYINPPELVVEADASSATYPLALAAVMGTGQHSCNCGVTILGVGNKSLQGDANFSDLLQKVFFLASRRNFLLALFSILCLIFVSRWVVL